MTEMDKRIVMMVDEGAATRIRELEADLDITTEVIESLRRDNDQAAKTLKQMDSRIEQLEEVIEHLCHQFACPLDGPSITAAGSSALREAFAALDWEDPYPVPDRGCDEPGCSAIADCGWPSDAGYRRTCGHHMPKEWK